jgi:hypothetical protein
MGYGHQGGGYAAGAALLDDDDGQDAGLFKRSLPVRQSVF